MTDQYKNLLVVQALPNKLTFLSSHIKLSIKAEKLIDNTNITNSAF